VLHTLQTLLAFFFVLGVLVFIHELGHFLMARLHGIRVHTFSLGFGWKLVTIKRGHTEYCLSAVPLGGYVKLAGETVDDERTGAPDEFLSQSRWVRFQVYLMGPIMNILLAIVLLAIVLYRSADVPLFESSPAVIGSVAKDSPAEKAGVRKGDLVTAIDARTIANWDDLDINVKMKANREIAITLVRDGQAIVVHLTPGSFTKYEIGDIGVAPVLRPQITSVSPGSPAERAGLLSGDVIVGVDGERGLDQPATVDRIRKHPKQEMVLSLLRAGQPLEVTVTPDNNGGTGQLGVVVSQYEVRHIQPGPLGALQMSLRRNWDNAGLIGRTLVGLFTRETPMKQLMGPVAIAQLSGASAQLGIIPLIEFMAMISLNLGLINLMPIPVMDGGQIAILAIEGATRRTISVKIKERILFAGFALIVLLMVTVIYNDVARLLR
jgi:regulator of sigma E protease